MDLSSPKDHLRARRISRVCWLSLIVGSALLTACASRGVAPVYDRGAGHSSVKAVQKPGFYQVKSGDTLYSIAWRRRLNYRYLAIWNRIKGPDYKIYPGQLIRLTPPPRSHSSAAPNFKKGSHSIKGGTPPKTSVAKARVADQPINKIKAQRPAAHSLKLDWRWPTKGRVVQTFSLNDPARKGVRIGGNRGQSIVAAESGKVVYSGSGLVGYGNLIIIKHNNDYLSAYGYNKKLLVKEGDTVSRGEQIAQMGSPQNGTDPVLHFEIRKQGKPVDPLSLLRKR